jgi:cell division septation protein DedD
MRDVERLRDQQKGGGQKAVLAFCALLLLGGVFSLGVLIGRRSASPRAPSSPAGNLAALDAEARKAPARPAPPASMEPAPEPAVAPPAAPPAARDAKDEDVPARTATLVPAPPRSPAVIPPPPPAHAKAPVNLTPPPRDPGAFTVQVGASQDRGEAARLEGRLRSAGLRPYVVQANLGAKGNWYRIRVGAFRDKDSANRFRKDVERELRLAAVVMPTR